MQRYGRFNRPGLLGSANYSLLGWVDPAAQCKAKLAPDMPSGATATAVSSTGIDLAWNTDPTAPPNEATSYVIERSDVSSSGPWTQIASVDPTPKSYQDRGLVASTKYWYQIKAVNCAGESAYTTYEISATTNAATVSVEYLVVAGGGGAGGGSGGGAGGYRTATGFSLTVGQSYTVTVGAGGAAGTTNAAQGSDGSDSVFSTITSTGGGGAGGYGNTSPNGRNGGSGGGAGYNNTSGVSGTAGSGTSGQGNSGGTSVVLALAGGGGANAGGSNGTANTGGAGGAGTASSITGTSVTRAGGGGGSGNTDRGAGGTGGGGNGRNSSNSQPSSAGGVNTGGGGGGGWAGANIQAGGSGVVILRYPNTFTATFSAGVTQTQTTSGSDKINTITAAGVSDTVTFN